MQAFGYEVPVSESECSVREAALEAHSAFEFRFFGLPLFSGKNSGFKEIRIVKTDYKDSRVSLFEDVLDMPKPKVWIPILVTNLVFDVGVVGSAGISLEYVYQQYLPTLCSETGLRYNSSYVFRPNTRVAVYGSAGLEIGFWGITAEAGAQVDVNLIKISTPISSVKTIQKLADGSPTPSRATVRNALDLKIESLSGSISVYVKGEVPIFGEVSESWEVFNWAGQHWITELIEDVDHDASFDAFQNRMTVPPDELRNPVDQ